MSTFHSGRCATRPGAIERTFRFRNFGEAFALVQKVAELAEAEGHHPDISFGWGYVTVMMQTKKIKGLHDWSSVSNRRLPSFCA